MPPKPMKGWGNRWRKGNLLASLLLLAATIPLSAGQPPPLAQATRALYAGDFERAATLAAQYLDSHPRTPAALILLARAEMAQGKHESAYERLHMALRIDPSNLDGLYFLGTLCAALSQIEYQELYAMAPDSARVHLLMAESFRAQQNLAKAEEEYLAALKADPRSVEILDALGDLKRSQFQFDQAITFYARALAIAPRDYVSAYGLGASYLYKHQPQQAIEYLRRAVELDPRSPAARLALGDAFWRADRPAEAVRELKAATALEPEMRQAYTLLARAYNKLGQSQEAREALNKVQELTRKEQEKRQAILASDDLTLTLPEASGAGREEALPED